MDWKQGFPEGPVPKLKGIELVDGGWIKKYVLTFERPDGSEYRYESVSRKNPEEYLAQLQGEAGVMGSSDQADAVCIAPITEDGRVVMIREFRYPLNNYCIGLPAGLMEKGEDPKECAARELWEETGYAVIRNQDQTPRAKMLKQASFSSVGMSAESVQVIYAQVENEPSLGQNTEESEYIDVFTVPVSEIDEFLESCTLPIGTRGQLILQAISANPSLFE